MGFFGMGRRKSPVVAAADLATEAQQRHAPAVMPAPVSNPMGLPEALARLAVGDRDRLRMSTVDATAKRLGVAMPVMRALVEVEAAGRTGFGVADLPAMHFEPAIFSGLTGGRHDQSNPDISYPVADERRLPASAALRWRQMAKAYVVNQDAALKAAAWGMFAARGEDHDAYGFASPAAMAAALAESEERQFLALEEWLRRHRAIDALKAKDWVAYGLLREGEGGRALAGRLYRAYRALTDARRRKA